MNTEKDVIYYHLPGLFEFYDFYSIFLPLYTSRRNWFYDWCGIGSIYGAPCDCIWGGGRIGSGNHDPDEVISLMNRYKISSRLTFSNSLLTEKHLSDGRCNRLCSLFSRSGTESGIILTSDLLLDYIKEKYPGFYFVSSTTKVITDFNEFEKELRRNDFKYVVPDFRLNRRFESLGSLSRSLKDKTEFLCNECCSPGCKDRKSCYENVSLRSLGEDVPEFHCSSPQGSDGYRFSLAMENPCFIGTDDIINRYMPMGFKNFKIEGRGLGSAVLLEFILYYMTRPEFRLKVRENIYLDSMLDLF